VRLEGDAACCRLSGSFGEITYFCPCMRVPRGAGPRLGDLRRARPGAIAATCLGACTIKETAARGARANTRHGGIPSAGGEELEDQAREPERPDGRPEKAAVYLNIGILSSHPEEERLDVLPPPITKAEKLLISS
jgi:hypothetical protein